jgi:hypothetical protein
MSVVPHGRYKAMAVSPLASGRLDPPDICLIYATPGQMILLINGLQWAGYQRFDWSVVGESSCADSWGRALATGEASLSIPCYAERRYGGVLDDELLMALPPADLPKAIAGMQALAKNGLRYPMNRSMSSAPETVPPSSGAQFVSPQFTEIQTQRADVDLLVGANALDDVAPPPRPRRGGREEIRRAQDVLGVGEADLGSELDQEQVHEEAEQAFVLGRELRHPAAGPPRGGRCFPAAPRRGRRRAERQIAGHEPHDVVPADAPLRLAALVDAVSH